MKAAAWEAVMDPERWTMRTQQAFADAQSLARRRGHPELGEEHLLAALLAQEDGIAGRLLTAAGADLRKAAAELDALLERKPRVGGGREAVSPGLLAALEKAQERMAAMRDEFVSVEHVLLGLLDAGGPAARLLKAHGAGPEKVLEALKSVRGAQRVTSQEPEATYGALEKYGRDLTAAARRGKLDPVIGRDELKARFRPEFLNRIDEVLEFAPLERAQLRRIVDVQLRSVLKRLEARRVALQMTDAAKDRLAEEGYDPAFGARPLKRVIAKRLVDPFSRLLLSGELKEGDAVSVDLAEGELRIRPLRAKRASAKGTDL